MRALLQSLAEAETQLAEVPCPAPRQGQVLIETARSLVSLGTEKMLVDFARAGWIEKARQQPDKVKLVLQKIRTDGVLPTLHAVRAKLDAPICLGYCNAGTVVGIGSNVSGFKPGDRVVSNGPHSEIVVVPRNLCARIPENVGWDEAPFTVLGAIALQGVRLAQPTLGESVTVTGLGLIGLICVQLLRIQGCRVLGIDLDPAKCELARQFGAETVDLSKGEDPIAAALAFSGGRGMDAVIITASTQSSEPVHQAAVMSRKRGRIILVGVAGLELSRADFYEKELTFQVSCSYGPGRYDPSYEVEGRDYPVGYVRWTAQRNFETILGLLAERRLNVLPLISHRVPFTDALKAYGGLALCNALGVLLEYGSADSKAGVQPSADIRAPYIHLTAPKTGRLPTIVIGVIGAGNFTGQVLLPALQHTGARLKVIASESGVTSAHLGRKFGFQTATTDVDRIFADPEINTVIITTRHDTHARFVLRGLEAGKRVYVEKPLCIRPDELGEIQRIYESVPLALSANSEVLLSEAPIAHARFLMVGFNRRFAPHSIRMRELLQYVSEPKVLVMTVNAGAIPSGHWTQSPSAGGGRVIGEACHFIDLMRYLVGAKIVGASAVHLGKNLGASDNQDTVSFAIDFADGSIGTVHYLTNGHRSFPKERLEVFCAGRILQLDNFRRLSGFGWPSFRRMNLWSQDKGHRNEMSVLVDSIRLGGNSPIPFSEILEVTRTAFDVAACASADVGAP